MADQPEICIITTATWQHVGTCCSDSVCYWDIAGASQWLIFWASLSYTRAVKFLILGYLLISGYILGCFLIFLPSLLATSIPLSLPFPSSRLYKLENSPKWGGTSPKMEKAVGRIPVYTVIAAHLVWLVNSRTLRHLRGSCPSAAPPFLYFSRSSGKKLPALAFQQRC